MKPVDFRFERAATLDEAAALLRDASGDAKLMSGGQSLGPMLNLRLARPGVVVGIDELPELRGVEEKGDSIEYGAALRHSQFEDGEFPEPVPGVLRHVASGIAYRAVRNRGTIGGSLCHADPAADWITALTALGGTAKVVSPGGRVRKVDLTRFMHGAYRTDLATDEVLKSIVLPRYGGSTVWGYHKVCRKVGDFGDAIAAWVADPEKRYSRVVFGATAGRPVVSPGLGMQVASTGKAPEEAVVLEELEKLAPELDRVKRHLLAVAFQRCIEQALGDG